MDRILVVDDDIMNLRMAEHILKKSYEVISVSSGREALDFLAQDFIRSSYAGNEWA